MEKLNLNELESINGGKYYGNGLYCDDKYGCRVDWSQAIPAIGQIIVNGWIENGPWVPRS